MKAKRVLIIAAIFGFLAVALGAFGAHALKAILLETGRFDTYQTAVDYHFYHSLALLLIGVLMSISDNKWLQWSAIMMTAGIIIFSGSLYVLCFTNIGKFGAITPIGGMAFLIGWALIGIYAIKKAR